MTLKNRTMRYGTFAFALAFIIILAFFTQRVRPNQASLIAEGEGLTLAVGEEMRVPFVRNSRLRFAGKVPGEDCGRMVAYSRNGIGLWVYEGRHFVVEGVELLVETITEDAITIRRLKDAT